MTKIDFKQWHISDIKNYQEIMPSVWRVPDLEIAIENFEHCNYYYIEPLAKYLRRLWFKQGLIEKADVRRTYWRFTEKSK